MSKNPSYVPDSREIDPAIIAALPEAVQKLMPGSKVTGVTLQGMEKIGPKIVDAVKKAIEKEMAAKLLQGEMDVANTAVLGTDNEDVIPAGIGDQENPEEKGEDLALLPDDDTETPQAKDKKKTPSLKNGTDAEGTAGPGNPEQEDEPAGLSPDEALNQFGEGGEAPEEPLTPEEEELAALDGEPNAPQQGSPRGKNRRPPQKRPNDAEPVQEQDQTAPEAPPETESSEQEENESEDQEDTEEENTQSGQPEQSQAPNEATEGEANPDETDPEKQTAEAKKKMNENLEEGAKQDAENPQDPYSQFDEEGSQRQNESGEGEEEGEEQGQQNGQQKGQQGTKSEQKQQKEEEAAQEQEQEVQEEDQQKKIEEEIAKRQKKLQKEAGPRLKDLNKEIAEKKKKERWLEAKIIIRTPLAIMILFLALLFVITIIFFAFGGMLAQMGFSMLEQSGEDTVEIFKLRRDMKKAEEEKKKLSTDVKKEQQLINKLAAGRNKLIAKRVKQKNNNPTQ